MDAKQALVVISNIVNEFESFVEGFDPMFWSDPEEFPEDCDEVTGRFGSETLAEVGRAFEVLKNELGIES